MALEMCTVSSMEKSKKKKVKSATVVEGDPKAPFSIATTLWCRGGSTP